jgi:glutamyl-tRNA synthetase
MFFREPKPSREALAERLVGEVPKAMSALSAQIPESLDATQASALIKQQLADHGLKMPQLAMALRLALLGQTETPSIDRVMAVLGRERIQRRIASALSASI